MGPARLRVVFDGPQPGALNMGTDDVLLSGIDPGHPLTLRLYGWTRPTVSLGYSQPWRAGYDAGAATRQRVDLVRRRTGGRAVLHTGELTYAIAGPADAGPLAGGIHATYRVVAEGILAGLALLGVHCELVRGRPPAVPRGAAPGACFAVRARYEIVADGRKLVGSAQRRAAGRVMQHGSLPLRAPSAREWAVLGPSGAAAAAASVGLEELTTSLPRWQVVAAALAQGLAGRLGVAPVVRPLSRRERRVASVRARAYADPAFTRRV